MQIQSTQNTDQQVAQGLANTISSSLEEMYSEIDNKNSGGIKEEFTRFQQQLKLLDNEFQDDPESFTAKQLNDYEIAKDDITALMNLPMDYFMKEPSEAGATVSAALTAVNTFSFSLNESV